MPRILHPNDLRGRIDFAIVTIRKDEFEAILDRFSPRQAVNGGRQLYEYARLTDQTGIEHGVALARSIEQGQAAAQSVARDVIDDLNPGWIILAGIAGGVPDHDFSLGDVLIANRLHDFSVSAAIESRAPEYQQTGGPMHPDVERVLAAIPAWQDRLGDWNSVSSIGRSKPSVNVPRAINSKSLYGSSQHKRRVRESLAEHFGAFENVRPPLFHVAPGATSGALVKDTQLLRRWQESARHLSHVEMEAGGIYQASRHGGRRDYPVLCVRGISDIVGFHRSRDWTSYACHSAASFVHALLRSGIIQLQRRQPIEMSGAVEHHTITGVEEDMPPNAALNALNNYKASIATLWHGAWRDSLGAADASKPHFVATQGLRVLNERKDVDPRFAINTSYFRRTRDEDGTREMRTPEEKRQRRRQRSDIYIYYDTPIEEMWLPLPREQFVESLLGCASDRSLRLVVATDAGLGKTTNMHWLHATLNERDPACVAFLINVGDLPQSSIESLDQLLASLVLQMQENCASDVKVEELTRLIRNRREAGQIILLVDALDQVELANTATLRTLRFLIADKRWRGCPIVLGSRPFALQRDWEALFGPGRIRNWQFVQIDEFTPEEQRQYLGDERYTRIPPDARGILGVPRVLYYLLSTPENEFRQIGTASDVYWLSTTRLLEDGLRSREATGLDPDGARLLLSAIAFEMSVCRSNFDQVREDDITWFLQAVSLRCRTFSDDYGIEWVQKTLRQIVSMNEFLAYAILEAGFPRQVRWRNRSLQEFFSGLWLSKFASQSDRNTISEHIYTYGDLSAADFYWIWRFAIEMPSVARTRPCWLKLVSPLLERSITSPNRRRPTELIYRAWNTLQAYLAIAPHDQGEDLRLARSTAARFRGEFQDAMVGNRGREARRIAKQLLAGFRSIPPVHHGDQQIDFEMGSPQDELGRGRHEPLHQQRIDRSFSLACYAVTAEQFALFDPKHQTTNPRRWRPRFPAIHISWFDAWVFCKWLGDSFRLPTEAEWEFACRAGTTTAYSFGDKAHYLRRFARCGVSAGSMPIPVGCLRPNPWGLFDMHGNCWEWCLDWYVQNPCSDPIPTSGQTYRVIRGGAFNTSRYRTRSAERAFREPEDNSGPTGFRVLKEI